jgi:Protein of unknown function (DUF3467)
MSTEPTEQLIFPQFYANLSQCSASPSDISITFGLSGTAPLGGVENGAPTPVALLRLSPPSAKMLMLNLQQMIQLYETRFAAIYVPKEFEEALRHGSDQLGLSWAVDPERSGSS